MIRFSTADLMDEDKCYAFLVKILHPDGLACPRCGHSVDQAKVHRRDRAPVLYYRCACGRIYNAFAGTEWQGTHHPCSCIVRILQGVAQGVSTKHLAEELDLDRWHLLQRRHRLQAAALDALPREVLDDSIAEADEMYQNAGEKRRTPSRPRRSAAPARQQGARPWHLGHRPTAGARSGRS